MMWHADMESIESVVDPAVLTGAFDTTACAALGCFTEVCAVAWSYQNTLQTDRSVGTSH